MQGTNMQLDQTQDLEIADDGTFPSSGYFECLLPILALNINVNLANTGGNLQLDCTFYEHGYSHIFGVYFKWNTLNIPKVTVEPGHFLVCGRITIHPCHFIRNDKPGKWNGKIG
jgi:hypothetical protein